MKILLTTLTLLVLSQVTIAQHIRCNSGCLACYDQKCYQCFKQLVVGNTCVPVPLENSHCLFYDVHGNCVFCQPGYSTPFNHEFQYCMKNEIKNCAFAGFSDQTGENSVCIICEDGYPAKDLKSCGGWNQFEENKVELGQQVNQCLWGFRDPKDSLTSCYRCKEGYTVSGGSCVADRIEGCMILNVFGTECDFCDPWKGYYMSAYQVCTKVTESVESQNMLEGLKKSAVERLRDVTQHLLK